MSVYSGTVVDGKVLVNGVLLPEGTKMTILVPEDEEPIDLSLDMIAELDESIAQADRGEGIPAAQVLDEPRTQTRS